MLCANPVSDKGGGHLRRRSLLFPLPSEDRKRMTSQWTTGGISRRTGDLPDAKDGILQSLTSETMAKYSCGKFQNRADPGMPNADECQPNYPACEPTISPASVQVSRNPTKHCRTGPVGWPEGKAEGSRSGGRKAVGWLGLYAVPCTPYPCKNMEPIPSRRKGCNSAVNPPPGPFRLHCH